MGWFACITGNINLEEASDFGFFGHRVKKIGPVGQTIGANRKYIILINICTCPTSNSQNE
jgi:predicted nucleic acid-binding Zn finger protein